MGLSKISWTANPGYQLELWPAFEDPWEPFIIDNHHLAEDTEGHNGKSLFVFCCRGNEQIDKIEILLDLIVYFNR